MLKKNKTKIILSSVVILLPMLFGLAMWSRLPEPMPTHWGYDGDVDGYSSKAFAVFGLPVFLLILQWLCWLCTSLDNSQREQSEKITGLILWIVPVLSLLVNGLIYATALGREISVELLLPVALGVLFLVIGNYLPKTKQNRTIGIKLPWTLADEENWNKTHRLGGKVWVICGVLMIFTIFLPSEATIAVLIGLILAMTVIPVTYSYWLYRKP